MGPPLQAVAIQKLLSTGAHIGQRTVADHLKQFISGTRNDVAVIDADKTLVCLRSAAAFVAAVARQKGRVAFAGAGPESEEIVEHTAKAIGCPSPSLWRAGGSLTNRFSPKKFRSRGKRLRFAPAQLPECVVVVGPGESSGLVNEAHRLRIPVVSLVDSDTPPELFRKISYPIPAGGSQDFVYLFCNLITKTYLLHSNHTPTV